MKEQCFLDFSMRIQLKWRFWFRKTWILHFQQTWNLTFPTSSQVTAALLACGPSFWVASSRAEMLNMVERKCGGTYSLDWFPFPGRILYAFLHLLKSVLKRAMNTDGSVCSFPHVFWDRKRLKMTDPASSDARILKAGWRHGWLSEPRQKGKET